VRPIEKILRKAQKPGFLVLQEFWAANNGWLSRWAKEHPVFSMDEHGRNIRILSFRSFAKMNS
jgi:hypothetical protein